MKKDAKTFLRHMIKTGGFITEGLYSEDASPRLWRSNNKYSTRMIDLPLFVYLRQQKLITKEKDDRYWVSEKGYCFAKPWWRRWFN